MGEFVGTEETETPEVDRSQNIVDDLNEMLADTDTQPVQEEVAPEPQPEPEAPQYIQVGEAQYDAAMAEDINQLVNWASQLTPEQYEIVNQALYGQPEQAPEPTPEPTPEPDPISYDGVDEETAQILRRQEEELEALKARLEETAQQSASTHAEVAQREAAEAQAQFVAIEQNVQQQLAEQYGFDQADFVRATEVAGEMGLLRGMIAQHGMEDGIRQTMMSAIYADEGLRQKVVGNTVDQGVQQKLADERRDAQAALNPQGGTNIPSQDALNLPISEKRAAMKADIDKMLGNL